jgi:glucans biosynthesis protein C
MSNPREHGLDALRVFAFAILIFYHSGMGFVTWDFHVKNNDLSRELEWLMLLFNRWRLPLLFFISGCGVWFSLRRRTLGTFARERLQRLLIPVLFGMFVTVPPQIYFERLAEGRRYSSYWEFHGTVFDLVPYPMGGSFSWHHLWFVVYLLVYSLVGLPVFAFLRSDRGRRLVAALADLIARWPIAFYGLSLPNFAVGFTLGPHFPTTHALWGDWNNLMGSFLTFLWGFVVASSPPMLDTITRRRREFLLLAVACLVVFYSIRLWFPGTGAAVRSIVDGWMGFLWIFALVGFARALVRTRPLWLDRANEAVYPFYILHQTFTVAAIYFLANVPIHWLGKLGLVMAATAAGSWVAYELLRRTPVTRVLIGMRS